MKLFVTGVGGQLGHDVMNELYKIGYEGIETDFASVYSGALDGTDFTGIPYEQLDITDAESIEKIITVV